MSASSAKFGPAVCAFLLNQHFLICHERRVVTMPSILERSRVQDERLELGLAFKVVFGLIVLFILIEFAICLGIKAHVLLNTASEVFRVCGYELLWLYVLASVVGAGAGFTGTLVMGLCADQSSAAREDLPTFCSDLANLVMLGTLTFYWFASFVFIISLWGYGSEIEEQVLFYSDFYGSFNFGNCTSGEDLYNLRLAGGVFKAESFIITLTLILFIPCSFLCCYCAV